MSFCNDYNHTCMCMAVRRMLCSLSCTFVCLHVGSGRSFRAYVFNRVSPQPQLETTKLKVESICHRSPTPLKAKAGMTHAALIDLQLQRIHVSSRPSDLVPQLSAAKGAAMVSDKARSARRAARSSSSSTSAATLQSNITAVKVAMQFAVFQVCPSLKPGKRNRALCPVWSIPCLIRSVWLRSCCKLRRERRGHFLLLTSDLRYGYSPCLLRENPHLNPRLVSILRSPKHVFASL